MLLEGKNALITGSNRGIGKAILETFAKEGGEVIWAHARTESADFLEYISSLESLYGTEIIPIYFDLMDTDVLKSTLREVIKSKKNIDILVNNAGQAHGGLFHMTPIGDVKKIFDVNLFAHMEITQPISRLMMKRKTGSIINMASISGIDLKPGTSAYGVSKAAVIAWTKNLSSELGIYGVRVNAIAPGLTDTRMATLMDEKAKQDELNNSLSGRLANPEEIANVALFLASDMSSHMNGQTLQVDSGRR